MKKLIIIFSFLVFGISSAHATDDWSFGVGYHNPPSTTLGLNFMYLWTNLAFELGLGWLSSTDNVNGNNNNSSSSTTYAAGGDVNLQYLFGDSMFRPYIEGGLATAISVTSGSNGGAGASLSDPFAGVGFYLMGSEFYVYASYIFINYNTFSAGLGFNL